MELPRRSDWWRRRHWIVSLAVLTISVLITLLVAAQMRRAIYQRDLAHFESSVQQSRDNIASRIQAYLTMLRAGAGLFSAQERVTKADFKAFADSLAIRTNYPGIQGIGFSRFIPAEEREAVVQALRADGVTVERPGEPPAPFEIWSPDVAPESHAIAYLEPLDARNHAAIGLNMTFEPVRRAAMEQARDNGTAVASGIVTLVQEIDERKQAGFLIYVPAYRGRTIPATPEERRKQLVGFVYSPFRADDLFEGIFAEAQGPQAALEVYDDEAGGERLMHASPKKSDSPPRFTTQDTLDVAGRAWRLRFSSTDDFDAASSRFVVPLVLMTGLSFSVALAFLTWRETKARVDAEVLVLDLKHTGAALRDSAARNVAILEGAIDGIVTMNHEGVITEFNAAAERVFGYTRAEALGRAMADVIIPPLYRDAHWMGLRRYLATGEEHVLNRRLELAGVRKDGREIPIELTITRNPGDGPPTFTGFIRDLTELRRTEGLLAEESAIVEAINRVGHSLTGEIDLEKLVQNVTDATTRLTEAQFGAFFYNVKNEQGEAYTLYTISGVPREKFSGFPMPRNTALFSATFRGEGVVRLDDVRRDPRYGKNEPHFGMPAGHLPVVSYLAVPVVSRSGETLGGLFFGHEQPGVFDARDEQIVVGIAAQAAVAIDNARLYDSQQKALEEARSATAQKEELLASERYARSELERAGRMKDEFLATLSHELRTPLNAVLGYATFLRMGRSTAPDLERGLEIIERNARVQAQLIDDLLDMNRIISGKLRLDVQQVDLPSVIEAALETVRPSAESREIRLQKVLDPQAGPVRGDPARLQQVIWNLLSNAIKFTPKNGRVQVLLERVNSHVEISVVDTGMGIEPDFLPHVFERFRQADSSTTRKHGGLGLGLSIVRHLVELHGGTIQAKSAGPEHGAAFVVSLPLAVVHLDNTRGKRQHPGAPSRGTRLAAEVDLAGVKALVVDDEPDACMLVKRILEQHRAQVRTATSAHEALELFAQERPQVLISDIGMPGEDGYELLRKVRALGGETPAIALTAFARSEDRTRAALAGFQTHVAKPVEPSELVAIVAGLTGRTGRAE